MFKNLYSLWLQPEDKVLEDMQKIIKQLAKQYSAPIFEPHITLLGDLNLSKEQALDRAFQLSSNLNVFTTQLSQLDYTDAYFKCVFIKAKESKQVVEIFEKARKVFKVNGKYMPHLSLMYGNLEEELK